MSNKYENSSQIENGQTDRGNSTTDLTANILERDSSNAIGTDSNGKVVSSLANAMIGSAIIVYPVLFIQNGILGSLLVLLMVGMAQYLTCRLLVIHNRSDESDFSISLQRILGLKLSRFNCLVNVLLLFFVCIAYFLLIVSNFFQISVAIIKLFKQDFIPPSTNQIHFNAFSVQWVSFVCMALVIPLLRMRSIDPLLKFLKYSIYCVLAYFTFIFMAAIRSLAQGKFDLSNYKLFDPDFSNVAGAFALSFLLHPVASPILKRGIDQTKNQRNLFMAYCLTAVIYSYIGIFGAISCAEQASIIPLDPQVYDTVFQCFQSTGNPSQTAFYIMAKLVQLTMLLQNFSVMPVLHFMAKKDFLAVVVKQDNENKMRNIFDAALVFLGLLISVLCIQVSIVLSFDGAIIGFFMGYGLPIAMHLKCHFSNKTRRNVKSSLVESIEPSISSIEAEDRVHQCNSHQKLDKKKTYILYGLLGAFGFTLGVFKIVAFIKS